MTPRRRFRPLTGGPPPPSRRSGVRTSSRPMRLDLRRMATAMLAVALIASPAFAQAKTPLSKEAQERLKEFDKNAASPEPRTRAEQMERLAAVDAVEAVRLLQTKGLKDEEYSVRERATWALSQMKADAARAAVATGLED